MATALDLITDSLVKARTHAPGEAVGSDKSSAALRELNRMLGAWSNENLLLHQETEETLTLVVDQASYTIGESGSSQDFDTVRPLEILDGTFVRESGGNLDYPLTGKTLEEYRDIRNKSTGSIPWWITYNPTYPNGTLYLFWTPTSAFELHLLSLKELTALATLTTTVSLPPGYEDAIIYNLALRLASDYGKTPRKDVIALATLGIKNIKKRNTRRLPPTQLEVGGFVNKGAGSLGDITTGPFI